MTSGRQAITVRQAWQVAGDAQDAQHRAVSGGAGGALVKVVAWDGDAAPAAVLREAAALLRARKGGEWTLMLAALLDDVARDADGARVVNGSLDLSWCDCPDAIGRALDVARAYLAEDEGGTR